MKANVRAWRGCAGFLLLGLLLPAALAETNSSTRVICSLKDGSRLVGRLDSDLLSFHYSLATDLKIPLVRIRAITWPAGETNALVALFNGDEMRANPIGPGLDLKMSFGEYKIPWSMVSRLQVDVSSVPGSLGVGIVHRWPGEGDANDRVGGAHGRLAAGAAFAPGKVGQAFHFDGQASYVEFPAEAGNFGTNDFTISLWLQLEAESCALIGKRPACDCDRLVFWNLRGSRGVLGFEAHSGTGDWASLPCQAAMGDRQFHHAAVTRQGKTFAIYVDGALKNRTNTSGVLNLVNTTPLLAGTNACIGVDGTVPFKGQLDEIIFYDRALSPAEIDELCSAKEAQKK